MTDASTAAAKAKLRARLKAARAELDPAAITAAGHALRARVLELPAVTAARTVFVYVSVFPEADTRGIIEALHAAGKRLYVPRIPGREPMRAVRFPGWDDMVPGVLGIPAPRDTRAAAEPIDVALVPGLAFTPDGGRLGYGAGYYDRWFAAHPSTWRVALALEHQIEPRLPLAAHDVTMDLIVTEARSIVPPASRFRAS